MRNAKELISLLWRHAPLIIGLALTTGALVFWLTRNSKQQYTSKALVSTGIISPFSIENPSASNRIDRDYALSELENLISLASAYETMEELATRLLAEYLQQPVGQRWPINEPPQGDRLDELDRLRLLLQEVPDADSAYAILVQYRQQGPEDFIPALIYSDEDYFGIEYLSQHLRVYRRGQSDLLEFIYTTTQPDLCQRTLQALIQIFMRRHGELKRSKTSGVVDYFAESTREAARQLQQAEQTLLEFRTQNNIINYDEQTRFIASHKEELDDLSFKEKMALNASEATLERLERQLGNRAGLAALNAELLGKKRELSELTAQLYKLEIVAAVEVMPGAMPERQRIASRLADLEQEISTYAQQSFALAHTPEGVAIKEVLANWLEAMITAEQAQARLRVIQTRQQEFAGIYQQYAPWGSQIKRIEREINLAEDAYLASLHSYNQAILHRENALMVSNLKILDAPFYPKEPSDSKRLLLILAGLIGGGLLGISTLIGLEFLDDNLKLPRVAAEQTGLAFGAVLPDFSLTRSSSKKARRLQAATSRSLAVFIQQFKVEAARRQQHPKRLLLASVAPQEGKTFLAIALAEALRNEGSRVLLLMPQGVPMSTPAPSPAPPDNHYYRIDKDLIHEATLNSLDWSGREQQQWSQYDYLIVEIPSLLSGWYPLGLLRQFDLAALVCRSDRSWKTVDRQALEALQEAVACPIRLVLNGVSIDALSAYMGALPSENKIAKQHLP